MRWFFWLAALIASLESRLLVFQDDRYIDSEVFDAKISLRKVGSIAMQKPAFVTAIPSSLRNNNASFDLLVSSFGVSFPGRTQPDAISRLFNVTQHLQTNTLDDITVSRIGGNGVTWPNEVSLIDGQVVVAGGFLVPGKKGHVSSMPVEQFYASPRSSLWINRLTLSKGFFHRIRKVNLLNRAASGDDDGMRWISCEGWKQVFGGQGGQMVFFPPASPSDHLTPVTLTPECDCYFDTVDINNDGIPEFIVPLFFGRRLSLIWTEHPLGDYTKPEFIRHRVIDDSLGAAFDIQVVDLNKDGQLDFLVTNHQDGKKGMPPSILAYTYVKPSLSYTNVSDWMNALTFERHVLASGFKVTVPGIGSAAPGSSRAVSIRSSNPTMNDVSKVLVTSGDGSEECYLSVPLNNSSMQFSTSVFHKCRGTVGSILTMDLDGDGWNEVVVPCYDENRLYFYTFKP